MPEFVMGSCQVRRDDADARRAEMLARKEENLRRQAHYAAIVSMLQSQRGESLRRLLAMFPCTGIVGVFHQALLIAETAEQIEQALAECEADDPIRPALEALASEYKPKQEPQL